MNTQQSADRRLIFLGLVAAIVIAGAFYLGLTGAFAPNESSASLTVPKTSHSFGDIDIFGGKVSAKFPLKNESDEPIDILWGKTTCMCTEGTIDGKTFGMHEGFIGKITINPGETKILRATYDPLAHGPNAVGPITRALILGTNSTTTEQIEVKIDGNVVKKT